MKKSAKNRIIVWSIVSCVLVAILVLGIVNIQNFGSLGINAINISNFKNLDNYTSGEAEIEKSKVRSLDINWALGEVNLNYGNSDKIIFTEESTPENLEDRMCWNIDGDGTLSIYSNKKSRVFFGISLDKADSKTLNIEVPRDMSFEDFHISSASADVNVDFVVAENVDIETASGDLNIRGIKSEEVDIVNVSGKSDVFCQQVGKLSMSAVSGDINAGGKYREFDSENVSGCTEVCAEDSGVKIECEAVSGSVTVALINSISGFTADYETVSGDFDCDFTGKNKENVFIYGDGKAEINAETVSGNIKVESFSIDI